jgi:hypothetical protein
VSGPSETGWLIEAPGQGQPLYWDGASWTADPSAAVRYARSLDAERVIAASHLVGAKAAEHMWCPPPAAAPPSPSWREG